MAVSDKPQQADLDRCVHCGLCLNACPTYRELHVEMDSPRGRIFQMGQVANGAAITESYVEHIGLCLACRGCETACPSGVQYGRLVEAARAEIETNIHRPWSERLLRDLVFRRILPSRFWLQVVGGVLYLYQASRLQNCVRKLGLLPARLREIEALSPQVQTPFFYRFYGQVLPAEGPRRYRVAFLGGCIANLSFARLNEATVRVLRRNGCEVSIPEAQGCCGALHVHAGLPDEARLLARKNIDALVDGGFDAIITNAAGCGSTLKEYGDLLEHDGRAAHFSTLVKDVNEFLASIELTPVRNPLPLTVTYQDSCHLAHGQKVRSAPRKLLQAIPGLQLKEMAGFDICCGSAGIYNVLHTAMSLALLDKKMISVQATGANVIATANPGCLLQLQAGVTRQGSGQRVVHVVELLDEAYRVFGEHGA
jgi:glycolate oxidase iron-sulfur subunit